MKNKNDSAEHTGQPSHHIPDVEIIDLEDDGNQTVNSDITPENPENTVLEDADSKKPAKRFRINMHLVLVAVVILFFAGIIYKIMNFGQYVDLDEIFKDGQGTYEDTYDEMLPLMGENGVRIDPDYSDGLTIVAFGNAPFADDRDSEDGLANMIAKEANATVYNCSISGSYMAAASDIFSADENPMDAYTLYWLSCIASGVNLDNHFINAAKVLGDATPPDAEEAHKTLSSIDFDKVDIITIMYDATDYLLGHNMYNFDNPTDITQFAGNLEASIELLQTTYPHIRIIVMSPTYAFAVDENGKYVSSDIQRYGQDVLSVYSIMEWNACASRSVTFVDHLYGTITEDNAKHYLTDNLHLNKAGRKKVTERFLYALRYFDSEE